MKRFTCFLALLFLCVTAATAQGLTIKGNVSDSTGEPLAGVSVIVKDTKKGAQTDSKGNFTLNVTSATGRVTLVFSSTNFKPQTITTDGKTALNVVLQRDVAQIEDVVVIGYQTVRRKDLLASVSSVGAKELKDIPINSAAEALNGRLAGVTATTSEGSPDADVKVRVRGGMSITGDNSPLYVVDGVVVENALSTISPQDIQTIDVLKDAAATAIYGARGGNGVIVITTKSGKVGKFRLSYNGFVGVKVLPKTLDVLDPYDFIYYQSERSRGNGTDSTTFTKNFGTTWDTLQVYKNVAKVNWQKETFGNTGFTQTHNLSGSGGTKLYTYTLGYTLNNDKAIVVNSKYTRHLFNAKADYKITRKLKLGAGVRYTNQNVWGAGVSSDQGTSFNRLRNAVRYRPFLSNGANIEDEDPFNPDNIGNGLSLINPIQLARSEYRKKTTNAYNVTGTLSYNFTKTLSFKSTFGYDVNKLTDRQYFDSLSPYSKQQGGNKPIAQLDTTERKQITNSNVLTYSLKNYKRRHNIDLLLGEETLDSRIETHSSLFRDFPNYTTHDAAFDNTSLGNSFTGYPRLRKARATLLSFFGRASYDYKNKYYVSFNLRADGSSKFGDGNKWGYFPAASAAWVISRENFMKNVDVISNLKLRAGFGTVGNNRIDDYLYITTFANDGRYYYGINGQPVTAFYPGSLVNENLKWESTVNRNVGLDISFLRRFDLSVDVYRNTSSDLLLNVPIDPTYGYSSQLQNIGKTRNTGFEIQLNAAVINNRKNNFTWNINFNISHNENKVVELGKGQLQSFPASSWFSANPADYIVKVGAPVGSMYGFVTSGFYTVEDFNYNAATGVYTLKPGTVTDAGVVGTVMPGTMKLADLNGDGVVDVDHDMTIIGDPTPDFYGGINQQFTYKQWDASIFINFSNGGDIYNANKIELTNGYSINSNMLKIMEDRWKVVTSTGQTAEWVNTAGQVVGIPPAELAALNANAKIWQPLRGTGASAFIPHKWAIEDGSFLRINNITIGYTLSPQKLVRMNMSKLRFYLTANNLALITKYTGYDPEVSVRKDGRTPNLDYSAYPKSRTFIFGVNVTF
jgi:TonB-dependent starch-binding outer membrane protein SusC